MGNVTVASSAYPCCFAEQGNAYYKYVKEYIFMSIGIVKEPIIAQSVKSKKYVTRHYRLESLGLIPWSLFGNF
jgi:hypothetical protein